MGRVGLARFERRTVEAILSGTFCLACRALVSFVVARNLFATRLAITSCHYLLIPFCLLSLTSHSEFSMYTTSLNLLSADSILGEISDTLRP